jgi:hypothetical protein
MTTTLPSSGANCQAGTFTHIALTRGVMRLNPMTTLFHVSEEPGITRFEPRASAYANEPVVWAIHADRLCNYLLPRDCPRVAFYAGPETTSCDVERFVGSSRAVVAIERGWLPRVRSSRLYCYHMPSDTFECHDACAGYYVSRVAVVPQRTELIEDPLMHIAQRGVEVRILPSLWPLRDAVVASSLQFSIIRMRNASPKRSDEVGALVQAQRAD